MSHRRHRTLLALILGIYLALAFGYGAVNPLFEAPDEHLHFFTAEYIAREGRLPTSLDPGLMGQEAAQPPLYYVLASLAVRAAGHYEAWQPWRNPLADPADPRGESQATPPINVNLFVHRPDEAWPWRGYALAAHLMRLLSTVLGLGTLLCVYGAGRTVWPATPERALLATALVAFLPQFAFVHGSITNDAAITFFSSAAIWQLLRITNLERSDTANGSRLKPRIAPPDGGRLAYVLLGVTIGLAILSKAAGILLLVYGAGVLAVFVWKQGGDRRWARAAGAVALVAVPALLVGGWLLWRNWTLYGDPTAANQFVLLAGGERPYTLRQVWHDMDRVWLSLFATFGWMNIRPPAWAHAVWSSLALAAVAGAAWGIWRDRRSPTTDHRPRIAAHPPLATRPLPPALILAGWFALVALAWLQFMLRTPADQGRLFFPALIPLALGAAYGLSRWPRPWTQLAAAGLALVTSVYCLLVVAPAAYAAPPLVAAVPAEAMPLEVVFPEGLELLGVRVETPATKVGEWAWFTLYWRAGDALPPGAPLVYTELFGRDFERIGLTTGYHGRGNFPATLWPPGVIVADRVAVRVEEEAAAPVEARLTVKLAEEEERVTIATVKVIPAEWPEAAASLAALGDAIELAAAELSATTAAPGEAIDIRLRWQVTAAPGASDLHVFAHLGNPSQPPLAQTDGPVMGGQYPPRLWAAGEVFGETLTLIVPVDLPPGEYPINVGLYDFDSGARLPVTVEGERRPTDTLTVGRLVVR